MKELKILILGFYHRNNLGDDLFKHIFTNLLKYHRLIIVNPDDLVDIALDTDLIICGGGDLINDYFMNKIKRLIQAFQTTTKRSIPVYAIGVGFPYSQLITCEYLEIFDLILTRNQIDVLPNINKIHWIPDLVTYLPRLSITQTDQSAQTAQTAQSQSQFQSQSRSHPTTCQKILSYLPINCARPSRTFILNPKQRHIGFFLARPMYSEKLGPTPYLNLLQKFQTLISFFTDQRSFPNRKKYQVHLFAMNTHSTSHKENDQIINQDLLDLFPIIPKKLHLQNATIPADQALALFKQLEFAVVSRYHAHILSILAEVPFISIACTRKVQSLLKEINLESPINMTVDPETMAPIDFNLEIALALLAKFYPANCLAHCFPISVCCSANTIGAYCPTTQICSASVTNPNESSCSAGSIVTTICCLPCVVCCLPCRAKSCQASQSNQASQIQSHSSQASKRNQSPLYKEFRSLLNLINMFWRKQPIDQIIQNLLHYQPQYPKELQITQTSQKIAEHLSSYLSRIHKISISSTVILKQGLHSIKPSLIGKEAELIQLISFYLIRQVDSAYNWGLRQQLLTPEWRLTNTVDWILKHEYQKHPTTWLNNTRPIENRIFNLKYFDDENLYGLHRAGWAWIMDELKTLHNPDGLIFDPFLDKTFGWRRDFYHKNGLLPLKDPWIGVFHHTPNTEYTDYNLTKVFQDPLFYASLESSTGLIVLSNYLKDWIRPKLNQLGYPNLPIIVLKHPTEFVSQKFSPQKFQANQKKQVVQIGAWLRDTYAIYDLPELEFLNKAVLRGKKMENYFPPDNHQHQVECNACSCRAENSNKYLDGLQRSIIRRLETVEIIEHLENSEYDQLLSENVVFLKLIDASAVNTLIESIVRNTPIVINPLPAVIEYLGPDYPLYYQTLGQATRLLNDQAKLLAGHKYLVSHNKDELRLEYFIQSLLLAIQL